MISQSDVYLKDYIRGIQRNPCCNKMDEKFPEVCNLYEDIDTYFCLYCGYEIACYRHGRDASFEEVIKVFKVD